MRQRYDPLDDLRDLDLPAVSGLSVNFAWSDLEPEPGRFRWERLEKARRICESKGKLLMIRVVAGMRSPDWLYQRGVRSIRFKAEETNWMKPGTEGRMPVPWEPAYLDAWEDFLRALGREVQGWSGLYCVQMSGGGFIGEMHLPKKLPSTLRQWKEAGINDEKLTAMWLRIITAYDKTMPADVGLALNLGAPYPKSRTPWEIYDWALRVLPGRVWFQQDGLRAPCREDAEWSRMIRAASSQTTVGYQMLGGGKFLDRQTGDRRAAFACALRDRSSYVEVYRGDIVDPRWTKAVEYLATGLPR